MMFVLPILAFFFSRDQLASRGYSDKDQNIYAGFISIFFVLLVIGSYILRIIADEDNWTPAINPKKSAAPTATNNIEAKQLVKAESSQIKKTKTTKKAQTQLSSTQEKNTNKPETKQNQQKEKQPQPQPQPTNVTTRAKENHEGVTKRDVQQNKGKTPTATQKKNTSKKAEKAAKPETKEEPKPASKKKIKSNNPFDYII